VLVANNDIKAAFDGLTEGERTKVISGFMAVKNEPFWEGPDVIDLSPDRPFTTREVQYSFQRKAKFFKGVLFIQLKILSFIIENYC
jgi:hypothetical protein